MIDEADPPAEFAIDVAVSSPLWRRHLPAVERLCAVAARAALAGGGTTFGGAAELSIVLGDDHLLRGLNRDWRGIDKPTNVLSFPALAPAPLPEGAPRLLGDVVLAFETVRSEAADQAKPLADHLGHLVVHGVLHLLGFDHQSAAQAARMEALEAAVLAGIGVPDPYRAVEAPNG
jgi:probable rRNA maturation factor